MPADDFVHSSRFLLPREQSAEMIGANDGELSAAFDDGVVTKSLGGSTFCRACRVSVREMSTVFCIHKKKLGRDPDEERKERRN